MNELYLDEVAATLYRQKMFQLWLGPGPCQSFLAVSCDVLCDKGRASCVEVSSGPQVFAVLECLGHPGWSGRRLERTSLEAGQLSRHFDAFEKLSAKAFRLVSRAQVAAVHLAQLRTVVFRHTKPEDLSRGLPQWISREDFRCDLRPFREDSGGDTWKNHDKQSKRGSSCPF